MLPEDREYSTNWRIVWLFLLMCYQSAKSLQYEAFPSKGKLNAQDALAECFRLGGTVPLSRNDGETETLRAFLASRKLQSTWLDARVALFPWVETSGNEQTPVTQQGCFSESLNFKEEHFESIFTFNQTICFQICLTKGYKYGAVKGRESRPLKVDTMSCRCGSSLEGAAQVSRRRCPYRCESAWCQVDTDNIPDLLVYKVSAASDSAAVTWTNEEFHEMSNDHTCALSSDMAISKADCWSEHDVYCIHSSGTHFSANTPMPWPMARQYCEERTSHLPDIREAQTLTGSDRRPFWISVSARHPTQHSSGSGLSYSHWRRGRDLPSVNPVCVRIDPQGNWIESACDTVLPLVCQIEASHNKPKTSTPTLPSSCKESGRVTATAGLPIWWNVNDGDETTDSSVPGQGMGLSMEAIIGIISIGLLSCVLLSIIVATIVWKRRSAANKREEMSYLTAHSLKTSDPNNYKNNYMGHSGTGTMGHLGTGNMDHSGTGTMCHSGTGTMDHSGTGTMDHSGTGTMGHSGTGTMGHSGTGTMDHSGTGTIVCPGCLPAEHYCSMTRQGTLGTQKTPVPGNKLPNDIYSNEAVGAENLPASHGNKGHAYTRLGLSAASSAPDIYLAPTPSSAPDIYLEPTPNNIYEVLP